MHENEYGADAEKIWINLKDFSQYYVSFLNNLNSFTKRKFCLIRYLQNNKEQVHWLQFENLVMGHSIIFPTRFNFIKIVFSICCFLFNLEVVQNLRY